MKSKNLLFPNIDDLISQRFSQHAHLQKINKIYQKNNSYSIHSRIQIQSNLSYQKYLKARMNEVAKWEKIQNGNTQLMQRVIQTKSVYSHINKQKSNNDIGLKLEINSSLQRLKKQEKIYSDNKRLVIGIITAKSNFKFKKYEEDYHKHQEALERLSKYSQSPKTGSQILKYFAIKRSKVNLIKYNTGSNLFLLHNSKIISHKKTDLSNDIDQDKQDIQRQKTYKSQALRKKTKSNQKIRIVKGQLSTENLFSPRPNTNSMRQFKKRNVSEYISQIL